MPVHHDGSATQSEASGLSPLNSRLNSKGIVESPDDPNGNNSPLNMKTGSETGSPANNNDVLHVLEKDNGDSLDVEDVLGSSASTSRGGAGSSYRVTDPLRVKLAHVKLPHPSIIAAKVKAIRDSGEHGPVLVCDPVREGEVPDFLDIPM